MSNILLPPTNKAANIINGITFHKFVSKIKNLKSLDKFHVHDTLVDFDNNDKRIIL